MNACTTPCDRAQASHTRPCCCCVSFRAPSRALRPRCLPSRDADDLLLKCLLVCVHVPHLACCCLLALCGRARRVYSGHAVEQSARALSCCSLFRSLLLCSSSSCVPSGSLSTKAIAGSAAGPRSRDLCVGNLLDQVYNSQALKWAHSHDTLDRNTGPDTHTNALSNASLQDCTALAIVTPGV